VAARLCNYARTCAPSFVFRLVVHRFEQGRESSRRRRRTQSSYVVVVHRLRSFIIIYLSVDSSPTTWLVSDNTKHAGCRCEQSLSILISFQVEPPSPWICPSSFEESKTHARRKPSGLEWIRFPVLGLPTLGRTATLGISRAFSTLSFTCLFPFLSLPPVRSDRCWEAQLPSTTGYTRWSSRECTTVRLSVCLGPLAARISSCLRFTCSQRPHPSQYRS
jgi:hypothetical protein